MKCTLRMSLQHYQTLWRYLFPGDGDEHGAVVLAGLAQCGDETRLLVREIVPAREGMDYVPGAIGYRALTPQFIHRQIVRCRDERLVYLAVHNHASTDSVAFSRVDMASHERGYPALRDIARGMPVGALVLGTNSIEADIWMPDGRRLALEEAVIIGTGIRRIYPRPQRNDSATQVSQERQLRMFGAPGQHILARSTVGVVGLGGVGSLVSEYLSRLGVGRLLLIDPDPIEETNLSRVVGATLADARAGMLKIHIAERVACATTPRPAVTAIAADVAEDSAANSLRGCDYIFLAADSMRARLVFNAVVHQYLIPGVQLGAKVQGKRGAHEFDAWSAVRPIRPGMGCLWCNQLIDRTMLAQEAISDSERSAQAYGTAEPNPSVITLNAVAAAHGVNDFLFDYLGIRPDTGSLEYRHLHAVMDRPSRVRPRADAHCPECGADSDGRYAFGDSRALPTFARFEATTEKNR